MPLSPLKQKALLLTINRLAHFIIDAAEEPGAEGATPGALRAVAHLYDAAGEIVGGQPADAADVARMTTLLRLTDPPGRIE